MAKQIIIHAGFHKTGTTALQQSLHDNRDALQLAGLSYLVVGAGAAAHNSDTMIIRVVFIAFEIMRSVSRFDNDTRRLQIDFDGDGVTNFSITLTGMTSDTQLTAGHFIWS